MVLSGFAVFSLECVYSLTVCLNNSEVILLVSYHCERKGSKNYASTSQKYLLSPLYLTIWFSRYHIMYRLLIFD